MTVKAKRFRIGVEGATTDGREIQREWLEQMAASYNPTVYTALINLEHIKSYSPDSAFNRYGQVTALVAEEIKDGPLAGKMALYADVEPTSPEVQLTVNGCPRVTPCSLNPSAPRSNGDLNAMLDETEAAWAVCADKVDTIVACQERNSEQAAVFTPRPE